MIFNSLIIESDGTVHRVEHLYGFSQVELIFYVQKMLKKYTSGTNT